MPSDNELRFISALLRATTAEQQTFYRKQIPKSVFVIRTREFDWVVNYRENYGTYPSAVAFTKKFNVKLPKVKDPVDASIQPILDSAMREQIKNTVAKTKKSIDDDVAMSLVVERFRTLADKVTSFSVEYSDIDMSKSEGAEQRYRERVESAMDVNNRILDSPWPTLNKVVKYFRGGEQVTLSARLGIGKSWVVCAWAHHLASKGIRVLVFTKEMPSEQFEDRMSCLRYGIDYELYREGSLPPKELRRWRREAAADRANGVSYPLIVVGKESLQGLGLMDIAAKCTELRPEAVFVDGAYLIRPDEVSANAGDVQRFTFLSNRFKAMAKFFRALFVLTVQDNREAEDKKGNSKGSIRTLYGADAWAQDSDYVVNLGGKRGAGDREVGLLKGRESGLVEFMMGFELEPPKFLDKGSPQPQPQLTKTTKALHSFTIAK